MLVITKWNCSVVLMAELLALNQRTVAMKHTTVEMEQNKKKLHLDKNQEALWSLLSIY